jgi:hypothetical protein
MRTFPLTPNFPRTYKYNGQHLEQWTRFTLTGEICKADNVPFNCGTDCLQYQIKSARATVCKGTDIVAYLADDCATEYIYSTLDGIAYVMSRDEYIKFVTLFSTPDRDSKKNGGGPKMRLKHESKALLAWLASQI